MCEIAGTEAGKRCGVIFWCAQWIIRFDSFGVFFSPGGITYNHAGGVSRVSPRVLSLPTASSSSGASGGSTVVAVDKHLVDKYVMIAVVCCVCNVSVGRERLFASRRHRTAHGFVLS